MSFFQNSISFWPEERKIKCLFCWSARRAQNLPKNNFIPCYAFIFYARIVLSVTLKFEQKPAMKKTVNHTFRVQHVNTTLAWDVLISLSLRIFVKCRMHWKLWLIFNMVFHLQIVLYVKLGEVQQNQNFGALNAQSIFVQNVWVFILLCLILTSIKPTVQKIYKMTRTFSSEQTSFVTNMTCVGRKYAMPSVFLVATAVFLLIM